MYILIETGRIDYDSYASIKIFKTYNEAKKEFEKRIDEIRKDLSNSSFEDTIEENYFIRNDDEYRWYSELTIRKVDFNEEVEIL